MKRERSEAVKTAVKKKLRRHGEKHESETSSAKRNNAEKGGNESCRNVVMTGENGRLTKAGESWLMKMKKAKAATAKIGSSWLAWWPAEKINVKNGRRKYLMAMKENG